MTAFDLGLVLWEASLWEPAAIASPQTDPPSNPCVQGAAVHDARCVLPLELAVRHNAPAGVVQALKQAHVSISALLKGGASDAEESIHAILNYQPDTAEVDELAAFLLGGSALLGSLVHDHLVEIGSTHFIDELLDAAHAACCRCSDTDSSISFSLAHSLAQRAPLRHRRCL